MKDVAYVLLGGVKTALQLGCVLTLLIGYAYIVSIATLPNVFVETLAYVMMFVVIGIGILLALYIHKGFEKLTMKLTL